MAGTITPDRSDPVIVQTRDALEIVAGLKFAAGLIDLTGLPADTNTITISDGTTVNVFEFDDNSSVTPGNLPVVIGVDAAATITNFISACNAEGIWTRDAKQFSGVDPIRIDALEVSGSDAASLRSTRGGTIGNVAVTKVGGNITVTGMVGGGDMGFVPTDADIDIGDVHLLNTLDAKINPATEDKQDDIISAISGAGSALVEVAPIEIDQVVAAAGTQVALVGVQTFCSRLFINAKKLTGDNTGKIYVGVSSVNSATQQTIPLRPTSPGDYWEMPIPNGVKVDLNKVFIDADTNGDGITGYYFPA